MKTYISGTLILALLVLGSLAAHAQDTKKDKDAEKIAATKNLVDSQNYVFIAQSASPMSGRMALSRLMKR